MRAGREPATAATLGILSRQADAELAFSSAQLLEGLWVPSRSLPKPGELEANLAASHRITDETDDDFDVASFVAGSLGRVPLDVLRAHLATVTTAARRRVVAAVQSHFGDFGRLAEDLGSAMTRVGVVEAPSLRLAEALRAASAGQRARQRLLNEAQTRTARAERRLDALLKLRAGMSALRTADEAATAAVLVTAVKEAAAAAAAGAAAAPEAAPRAGSGELRRAVVGGGAPASVAAAQGPSVVADRGASIASSASHCPVSRASGLGHPEADGDVAIATKCRLAADRLLMSTRWLADASRALRSAAALLATDPAVAAPARSCAAQATQRLTAAAGAARAALPSLLRLVVAASPEETTVTAALSRAASGKGGGFAATLDWGSCDEAAAEAAASGPTSSCWCAMPRRPPSQAATPRCRTRAPSGPRPW